MPDIIELVNNRSSSSCLVLHLQCGLPDISYDIRVITKDYLSEEEADTWDRLCGLDAGFSFSISGTVDYPDPCAGIRAGLRFNRLGGEFLYYDRSQKRHIGTGAFVNNSYFTFEVELPNRPVRDILMKLLVLDRAIDQAKDTFGMRIDIINLSSDTRTGSAVIFDIARIYL